jgi:hypothetical protein
VTGSQQIPRRATCPTRSPPSIFSVIHVDTPALDDSQRSGTDLGLELGDPSSRVGCLEKEARDAHGSVFLDYSYVNHTLTVLERAPEGKVAGSPIVILP